MPRSTVSPAKPIAPRQVERALKKFEPGMNAMLDLCRPIAPESVAGPAARRIVDQAFELHAELSALLRFVRDTEREGAVE